MHQSRFGLDTDKRCIKHGIPQELTVPMAQWLSAHRYYALPTVMEAAMVLCGYGDITQTPAVRLPV